MARTVHLQRGGQEPLRRRRRRAGVERVDQVEERSRGSSWVCEHPLRSRARGQRLVVESRDHVNHGR